MAQVRRQRLAASAAAAPAAPAPSAAATPAAAAAATAAPAGAVPEPDLGMPGGGAEGASSSQLFRVEPERVLELEPLIEAPENGLAAMGCARGVPRPDRLHARSVAVDHRSVRDVVEEASVGALAEVTVGS